MTKTSRSIQLVLAATTLASLAACSSGSPPPTPIVGSGGAAATTFSHPIPFHGAWTPIAENDVGIQGAFYILEDAVKEGVVITDDGLDHTVFFPEPMVGPTDPPHSFDGTSPGPCITGTAKLVVDPKDAANKPYDLIWGGGIGMNLSEPGGVGSTPMPFNAAAENITGFEFTLSGDPGTGEIRFKATMAGSKEDFCLQISPVVPGVVRQVRFSEFEHKCWEKPPADVETIDVTKLEAIQWQVVTSDKSAYNVKNFCVTGLGYLTD